jgi:hypothetical protein
LEWRVIAERLEIDVAMQRGENGVAIEPPEERRVMT